MTVPKIPSGADSARRAVHGAKKTMGRKFTQVKGNATSKPAHRLAGDGVRDGKFGSKDSVFKPTENKSFNREARVKAAVYGLGAGSVAGGAVAYPFDVANATKHAKASHKNNKVIRAQKKEIKELGKAAPRHLITDVGTAAGKAAKDKKLPGFVGRKTFLASAGAGAGLGVATVPFNDKMREKVHVREKKTIARNQKKLKELRDVSKSAFGVEHGDVSKALRPPKTPNFGPSSSEKMQDAFARGQKMGDAAGKKLKKYVPVAAVGGGAGYLAGRKK